MTYNVFGGTLNLARLARLRPRSTHGVCAYMVAWLIETGFHVFTLAEKMSTPAASLPRTGCSPADWSVVSGHFAGWLVTSLSQHEATSR